MGSTAWPLLLYIGIFSLATLLNGQATEEEAQQFIQEMEPRWSELCYKSALINWKRSLGTADDSIYDDSNEKLTKLGKEIQQTINSRFSHWKTFQNPRLRQAFKLLTANGPSDLADCKVERMNQLSNSMTHAYSTATVCKYGDSTTCDLRMSDLEGIIQTSFDAAELEHYFTAWHNKMSSLVTPTQYAEYADLLNENAQASGFPSEAARWMEKFNDDTELWSRETFQKSLLALELQLKPMYDIFHAYVRMKLRRQPEYQSLIEPCGYLPIHLLGNMWAQEWIKIDPICKPFPNAPRLDATEAMVAAGYTPLKMYLESDRFFKELGLSGVFPEFFDKSVIERPPNNSPMECHPSAWDFCRGKNNTDYRIQMCTKVTQQHLFLVHHEMGHLEYYVQYRHLEWMFRTSANPGFGEAVGNTFALAVLTPGHLQCKLQLNLGLPLDYCEKLQTGPYDVTETDINYLFLTALDKMVFFPFSKSIDTWRFDVFEGRIKPEEYNYRWWEIRKQKQGIIPPGNRMWNQSLFDPAGKYHIVGNVEYVRYYVMGVLTFQFYEAMCIASGEYDPNNPKGKPLYMCDFSGSRKAGALIKKMLRMGKSQGWPEALEVMTGTREMTIEPFRHYLKPLLDHMERELKENNEVIGFGDSCEAVQKEKAVPLLSVDTIWEMTKAGTP